MPAPQKAALNLYTNSDRARKHDESKRFQHLSAPVYLDEFRKDLLRVIHEPFFRRLQGKTQLFPAGESDYFRNRLTHSIEVSMVAEAVALKINSGDYFAQPIDLDLIRVAALCHDAGHPPFAHKGERALARLMAGSGSFEGNAQTLHIVAKGAKLLNVGKTRYAISGVQDNRAGLNLTARAFASLLKYDKVIPGEYTGEKPLKGYYAEEADLVVWIKEQVTGVKGYSKEFRTIECEIMDIADDIAYSVFDLEDALHAGFLRISDLLSDSRVAQRISSIVASQLEQKGYYPPSELNDTNGYEYVIDVFWRLLKSPLERLAVKTEFAVTMDNPKANGSGSLRNLLRKSRELASNGYHRSGLTFELLHRFIDEIKVDVNTSIPALSTVRLSEEAAVEVECIKQFVAQAVIRRSRVQVAEWRADRIISDIFRTIQSGPEHGAALLPEDFAEQIRAYEKIDDPKAVGAAETGMVRQRNRLICDFIAGMTERYALEFHGRLFSNAPETLFKPI